MHEYPITLNIIETAVEYANGSKVSRINLTIGENSGVLAESIRLYFDIISKGTLCENAEISVENIKPKLKCKSCGVLFIRKPFSFECTECGGEGCPTEIGNEFFIKSIEVF